jgi:hypothetical protein
MPRPSKDEATMEGPLRLMVAGGLLYMFWLAARASSPFAPAPMSDAERASLPSADLPKGS